jgi:Protein of unknown function (DUF3618)
MGEDARASGAQVANETAAREPHEIRRDIESTRREMGDTVEALAEKTDVKTQAQQKIAEVKQTIEAKRGELMGKARGDGPDGGPSAAATLQQKARENPVPVALACAFTAGLLLGRITGR